MKLNAKRLIAVLLCAVFAVTLVTACGDGDASPKKLDGTVWPLAGQTFGDGTGYTAEELNNYGLYGCLSFSDGKFTLMLDTSPLAGEYTVDGDKVSLSDFGTLTRVEDTLVLEMNGAAMTFRYDASLTPVAELDIDGTEWKLTYMKSDTGVMNKDALAEAGYSGSITFSGKNFSMVSNYAGALNTQFGTYEAAQAIVTLTVNGEYIYGFINGANLIVAESGISMVYTIEN